MLFRTIATLAVVHCFASSALAINIPTVPVGNAGNAADSTGYGAVNYDYRIGTTEVTVGQYTAFLNAVAATDTYFLFHPSMATDLNVAGISQSGASGSYTYSVIGSPNKPITYVNWGNAARFSNWLHNGQPTGSQGPSTTENGAYTLNGATSDMDLQAVTRNADATWFIPSESEWYKAAYHQPAALGGDSDDYWMFPMATNDMPYSDQPPGTTPDNTRVGNFLANDFTENGYNEGYAVTGSLNYSDSQNYLTDGGAYSLSSSFYGTFDQGGNVWEWNEDVIKGTNRRIRGGSWENSEFYSAAPITSSYSIPSFGASVMGFRVATIPEPSTCLLGALALAGLLAFRRKVPSRPSGG